MASVLAAGVLLGLVTSASAHRDRAVAGSRLSPAGPNGDSWGPTLSWDGRLVAFSSDASNLVAGDTDLSADVFVRDRSRRTTARASVSRGREEFQRVQWDGTSPSLSANGRFVAFDSDAPNLVAGDTNAASDVFVCDLVSGKTVLASVGNGGVRAAGGAEPQISADGRFVVFRSAASNLVAGDTNEQDDVFLRDLAAGTTERVSVANDGSQGNGASVYAQISADGRFVVFSSYASNLVAGDTNGSEDVFVRDRLAGTTERADVSSSGAEMLPRDASTSTDHAGISANGRFVVFQTYAPNLAAGDTNYAVDVFVRDRAMATTTQVDLSSDGEPSNSGGWDPTISADGRFVAFESNAANLVAPDPDLCEDDNGYEAHCGVEVFVRDMRTATTTRVTPPQKEPYDSGDAAISPNGEVIAFASAAKLAGQANGTIEIYARRWRDARPIELISVPQRTLLRAGPLRLRPWPARVGKPLVGTFTVTAGGRPVAAAQVLCPALLNFRTLPARRRDFARGRVTCTWQVPKRAARASLKGSVIAANPDGETIQRFEGLVR